MDRQFPGRPQRDARHMEPYRGESRRMREEPPPSAPPVQSAPRLSEPATNQDAAVILPLLLLLFREGADRYLLLALLYILM